MPIEFDPAKSRKNEVERGLSFEMAERFLFPTAIIRQDTRYEYFEPRFQAIGRIPDDDTVYFLVFTPLAAPDDFRVISFRKADRKERKLWLASQTPI